MLPTLPTLQSLRVPRMRELDGRRLVSRVKGRPALERRARGFLVAVQRFGSARATSHDDLSWCARWIDGLTALLDGRSATTANTTSCDQVQP